MALQLFIIFAMLAFGELVVWQTGVRIPSSIIGMLTLTLLLKLGIIKLRWVKSTSNFLTGNLAFFFIPPGVSLMLYYGLIKSQWIPITVSIIVSTILVMASTVWTYKLIRKSNGNHRK